MLYVTNQARQELTRLYKNWEHRSDQHLRLVRGNDGELGLDMGERHAEDESLEYEGRTLICFEPALVSRFRGVSLDAYDTPEGPRLIISKEEELHSHASVTVNWVQPHTCAGV